MTSEGWSLDRGVLSLAGDDGGADSNSVQGSGSATLRRKPSMKTMLNQEHGRNSRSTLENLDLKPCHRGQQPLPWEFLLRSPNPLPYQLVGWNMPCWLGSLRRCLPFCCLPFTPLIDHNTGKPQHNTNNFAIDRSNTLYSLKASTMGLFSAQSIYPTFVSSLQHAISLRHHSDEVNYSERTQANMYLQSLPIFLLVLGATAAPVLPSTTTTATSKHAPHKTHSHNTGEQTFHTFHHAHETGATSTTLAVRTASPQPENAVDVLNQALASNAAAHPSAAPPKPKPAPAKPADLSGLLKLAADAQTAHASAAAPHPGPPPAAPPKQVPPKPAPAPNPCSDLYVPFNQKGAKECQVTNVGKSRKGH